MKFKILILVLSFIFVGCEHKLNQKTEIETEYITYNEKTTKETETQLETEERSTHSENQTEETETQIETEYVAYNEKPAEEITEKTEVKLIDLKPLCQYPELQTGCEITSLTMVLNYYNINADKCDLSDNYLDKGPVGETDFRKAFEGDPRDPNSYGCYAPVIKNTANRYLAEKNSQMTAKDLTGTEFEDLFTYVDMEIPVIVWATLDCREGHYSVTWHVNGEDLTWFTPEHCMVLVGYDSTNSLVWVGDPVHGDIRSYDKEIFKNRYNSLKKQAIVIE